MELSLDKVKPTEKCVVVGVTGEGLVRRRLFDMGITPGVEIYVRKMAPLGDPVELMLRGYELSIRKEEAESVLVTMRP